MSAGPSVDYFILRTYLDLLSFVQEVITKSMKFCKLDPKVCHFEEVLDLFRIRVWDSNIPWKDPKNNLSIYGKVYK